MADTCKTPEKYTEGTKEDLKAAEAASPAQEPAEGGGSCLCRIVRIIPPHYRNEFVQLSKLAGPVVRGTINLM